MFSTKIYVLSVFVFSLFSLGQAAPIIDDISPLSTRELLNSTLQSRGFFENLFGKKLNKTTQALVNNVSVEANCLSYNIYTTLETGYKAAEKEMTSKIGEVANKKPTPVQAEYKKRAKQFKTSAQKVQKKIDGLKKKFTKLGVKSEDIATKCASSSHTDEHTLAEKAPTHSGPAETTESHPGDSHPADSHPEHSPPPATSN